MTKIEWTDATWNPTTGCTRVSAGCDHCYAVPMTRRLAGMGHKKYQGLVGKGHFNGVVKCHEDALEIPLRWRKPRMVFVNSMSDLFHRDVPFEFIGAVFGMMQLCRQHTFQLLTKRPERIFEFIDWLGDDPIADTVICLLNELCRDKTFGEAADIRRRFESLEPSDVWPFPNVWLGTSVEDQPSADERIPHLLRCRAAVIFLSCEPLLNEIGYLASWLVGCDDRHLRPRTDQERFAKRDRKLRSIHWVIIGGESGPGARPCDIGWIRSIRDQCKAAGVPCFVKQLGRKPIYHGDFEPSPEHPWAPNLGAFMLDLNDSKGGDMDEWPEDLRVREWPTAATAEVV